MNSTIVHDWIYSISGAEKVLEAINNLYPSDIYTLVKNPDIHSKHTSLDLAKIKTSFLQKFPFATKLYPNYLPFFPGAIERFDLREYDLILSSSCCAAKGIRKKDYQLHICYCHTPMRFLWGMGEEYLKLYNLNTGLKKYLASKLFAYLRKWDIKTSKTVDHFIANSTHTAKRIYKAYKRDSTVIYPPVNVEYFSQTIAVKEDYFVTAGRFVPYKRIDLIIEAFNQMPEKKLLILGHGPQERALSKKITSKNIKMGGFIKDKKLREHVSKAKAFIYMAEEDFGILPVEAQACGTPVIAYKKGGVSETTIHGKTSILFENQTVGDLIEAVRNFEVCSACFSSQEIKDHAKQFSKDEFNRKFVKFVSEKYNLWKSSCL